MPINQKFVIVNLKDDVKVECRHCSDYEKNPVFDELSASVSSDGEDLYVVYCPYCRGHLNLTHSNWSYQFRRLVTPATWIVCYVLFAVLRLGRKDHPWKHQKWGHFFTLSEWADKATDANVNFSLFFIVAPFGFVTNLITLVYL